MFYPSDRINLRKVVDSYLADSGMEPEEGVNGIVSPHAGYVYSGAVAGAAFARAPKKIDTVVIIAPPHRYPVRGASVFDGEGCRTPIGTARINEEAVARLIAEGCTFQPQAHGSEHSAEVQIPFVQVKWPDADIVVILQGDPSPEFSASLAKRVLKALENVERGLVVASSDLSHYHSQDSAREKDSRIISAFTSGDSKELEKAAAAGGEACGIGPISTLMHYAGLTGACSFEKLMWKTSADTSGDRSSVVGYFAGCCAKEDQ